MKQSQPQDQPQITIDEDQKLSKTQSKNQQTTNKDINNNPENQNTKEDEHKKFTQTIQHIRQKHPQCIPVFYVKHEAASSEFPSPKIPFILFKKQLKIQQAMYNLYTQIQIKGLYFFCTRYDQKQKKVKYVIIKPGETIEQIYKKYGRDGHLTLIYGDKNIGMGGIKNIQKWLIRILIVMLLFWVFLYAQPMYYAYEAGGLTGVWEVFSLLWNRPQRRVQNEDTNQTESSQKQQNINQNLATNEQVLFTSSDIPQTIQKQGSIQQQKQQQTL